MSTNNQEQIAALKENLKLCQEKRNIYMRESIITASVVTKFELKQRIKECDQEIKQLNTEISKLQESA